ncbi:MAG TPA: hypothetical protein VEX36_05425 [Thermoleophilaceae bacterium]|nr:hypothetical protein [Thermoleophilaceae bacterium]
MSEHQDEHEPIDVDEEAEAAAAEAARIGGPDPLPDVDPAQRPLIEGGEGVAEGFELAEEQLQRNASHEDRGADPMRDAGEPEPDSEAAGAEYGEPDHVGAQGEDQPGGE